MVALKNLQEGSLGGGVHHGKEWWLFLFMEHRTLEVGRWFLNKAEHKCECRIETLGSGGLRTAVGRVDLKKSPSGVVLEELGFAKGQQSKPFLTVARNWIPKPRVYF